MVLVAAALTQIIVEEGKLTLPVADDYHIAHGDCRSNGSAMFVMLLNGCGLLMIEADGILASVQNKSKSICGGVEDEGEGKLMSNM